MIIDLVIAHLARLELFAWLKCSDADFRWGSRNVWYDSEPNVDFSGPILKKKTDDKTNTSNSILEATSVYYFGIILLL